MAEGTDQYLSVIDQLNIGVRHIEIDINWGPYVTLNLSSHIVVCHTPVVDPIIPATIQMWANNRSIPLNYDPLHLACPKQHVSFIAAMQEINDWLQRHPNELVIIYYDTKWPIDASQSGWGTAALLDIFGDAIFTPTDYENNNNSFPTVNALLSNGKNVIIETQTAGWTKPYNNMSNNVVFYPALWDSPNGLQFGPSEFVEFPMCTIKGLFTYNQQLSRDLGDVVTEASTRHRQYHKIVESVTKCGVNIASPHMVNPHEMDMFVWSFGYGQPDGKYKCVAQKPNLHWATKECSTEMNIACLNVNDNTLWYVTKEKYSWNEANKNGATVCGVRDYVFAVPTDGYQNALINVQSLAKYVWLNVNTDDFIKYRQQHNMKWY